MRLHFRRRFVTFRDITPGADLSDIPGAEWDPRARTLRVDALEALKVRAELVRRGVRFSDGSGRAADPTDELLDRFFRARSRSRREWFARRLARRGRQDEVVLAALVQALEEDPVIGAECLAEHGDARAIPELSRVLDGIVPGECAVCDYMGLVAVATAIEILGGSLEPRQHAKLESFRARQAGVWVKGPDFDSLFGPRDPSKLPALAAALTGPLSRATRATRSLRPGRNDPCHCGSGRKYKRCCLDADAAVAPRESTRH